MPPTFPANHPRAAAARAAEEKTRREIDRELLQRLKAHGQAVTLAVLFDGWAPTWAVLAADRLQIAGLIHELPGELVEPTAVGLKALRAAA